MFRQVKVNLGDVKWQEIHWKNIPEDPVFEFWLFVVTNRTAYALFLSTRAIQQFVLDEKHN